MADNIIAKKTEDFAVRIVKLWKYLTKSKEYEMSNQIKRSGTSIGANVVEGLFAQSKKDFISKMNIALKECAETQYWLRLLHRTEFLTDAEFSSLNSDANEIGKILSSIINSAKKTINYNNNNNNDDDIFVIGDEE
jgi:four helix bundle protein